jgi:YesN/AraC family two-component response regulator
MPPGRLLEAGDGETGLDVAMSHDGPIDVLLTDVIMPNMGGVELAACLPACDTPVSGDLSLG